MLKGSGHVPFQPLLGWREKRASPLSGNPLNIHEIVWRTKIGHEFGINAAVTHQQQSWFCNP